VPETSDGRATSRPATDAGAGRSTGGDPGAGICPFALCPICATLSVVNRASPQVVDHLLSAAREFLLAARAAVDARAADYEDRTGNDELHRIDIR
jgi:hypothetical protein